jgi:hypothetical protein
MISEPTQRPISSSVWSAIAPASSPATSPVMARLIAIDSFRIDGSTGGRSRRRIAPMMRSDSKPSVRSRT